MNKYEFIRELPSDYLACRDLRHAWHNVRWYMEPDKTLIRVTSCLRCGTIREEIIVNGEKVSSSYSYPEGFLYRREEPDELAPKVLEYRRESALRAKPKNIKDRSEIHHA